MAKKKSKSLIRNTMFLFFSFWLTLGLLGEVRAQATAADSGARSASSDGENTPERESGSRVNVSGKPMHVSANRSIRDLKNNRLELFGNVYIRRPQELLTADYAVFDLKNETLVAEGNVV